MLRRLLCLLCIAAPPCMAAQTVTCTPTNNQILFGTYNPLSTSVLDSTATFIITCVNAGNATTVSYTATLSNQTLRQLAPTAGSDRINYDVYIDSTRATVWGDGTGGTGTLTGSITVPKKSSASTPPLTYYGRITAGQDVSATSGGSAPTSYSQTLTITVTCPGGC